MRTRAFWAHAMQACALTLLSSACAAHGDDARRTAVEARAPTGVAASWGRPRNMVDLTHTLAPEFPFIPVQNKTFPFRIAPIATVAADGVYANRWELTEHVGTHMDAPSHFMQGGAPIDQLAVSSLLLVPLAVASIEARADVDPDATFGLPDLLAWERDHGRLPDGAALFVHTGWEKRASEPGRFVNQDAGGTMHFPGFSVELVSYLLEQRSIIGIGIDTLSIDPGRDPAYPVHKRLFASGRWSLECLANLSQVPAAGAFVVALPLKVRGASGSPARVVAVF